MAIIKKGTPGATQVRSDTPKTLMPGEPPVAPSQGTPSIDFIEAPETESGVVIWVDFRARKLME